MTTAISTVVNQSAFSKQNISMAELFANRLHDLFTERPNDIRVSEFGTKECSYRGIVESISFTRADGIKVTCEIITPKAEL